MIEIIVEYKIPALILAFSLLAISIYIQRRGLKQLNDEEKEKAEKILKNYKSIPFLLLAGVLFVAPFFLGDTLKFILLYMAFVLLSLYKHFQMRSAGISDAFLRKNASNGILLFSSFAFMCIVFWSITVAA